MSLGDIEILGIVADGFQILLILLILLLLVRYRNRAMASDCSGWASSGANPFRHEFLVQSLRHQTEMAFDLVENTLQAERRKLRQLCEPDHQQLERDGTDLFDEPLETAPFEIDETPLADEKNDDNDPYREVLRLAADGVNPHRIAKQLSIPRGEVELVLKMSASPSQTDATSDLDHQPMSRRAVR